MKLSRLLAPFICCLAIVAPTLYAQVGNNNLTGPSGEFNGSITTACSYDPYTANATRAITDIAVAGAVGQYGLTYSRVWNTRTPLWRFAHDWWIQVDGAPGQNETYYITYPDGREETFTHVATDVDFRAAPGVPERLERWTATNGNFGAAYLVLPDGGKIEFSGTRIWHYENEPPAPPVSWYEFQLTATAMIDPYGQRTTYTTNTDGSFQITEPANRWIKVYYVTSGDAGGHVDYVRASDGREVHYTWETQNIGPLGVPHVVLTSVSYYGDPSLTATYTYQVGNIGKVGYALATCDDPMYPGPMKQIQYVYRSSNNPDGTARVVGQIQNERCVTTGDLVSTLTVTGENTRVETRADGKQRTFTYSGPYLMSWTDFKNVPSSQTYDSNFYVNSVTDGRNNTTNFIRNPLSGAITEIKYPATPGDTTPPTNRGTVTFKYGWPQCPDPNNRDANNPYYLYSTTDEAGNETRLTRDPNKRVTRIDYPDGGYETFSYNPFGQVLNHQMKTGGVESFTYDGRGLRQTYRSPDNPTGNATARYQYDALDRVSGVTDVLGSSPGDQYHTTNYQYNSRGQVTITTLPVNPIDYVRHTIISDYNNGSGTLMSVTDPLGHVTTYSYDDYRRLRSVTTPLRAPGDSTARTTSFSYHRSQLNADDYTHTDANVTLLTLPSQNIVRTTYDENYRKSTVTASSGSGTDAATTSYGYDNASNLRSLLLPDEQPGQANYGKSTTAEYDERNRVMWIKDPLNGPLNHYTQYTYDAGGRTKTVTQPNGQTLTYDTYDSMNRVLQQTATQTPDPAAVTKYTYEPTGLHMTMQDPRLVQISSNQVYAYEYDQMGRMKSLTYPTDSWGINRTEIYSYDTSGRISTYTTRDGKVQTFSYDSLHRKTGFTWSAGGAPNVSFTYDAGNRVTSISNANAVVARTYFDDNLLKTETVTPNGGTPNTVAYAWNADAQRESILYPSGKKYRFNYTGRDQLKQVQDNNSYYYQAEYVYDVNGKLSTRKVGTDVATFGIVTNASQRDALGRCTHLTHQLTGGTRTLDYVYDSMGNRTSIQRNLSTAETYGYDSAQQIITGVDSGNAHTYGYDANGNRTSLDGGGTYVINNLNQHTTFGGQAVSHNVNGDVATFGGELSYLYDAQNRVTSVTYGDVTTTFTYDGLNRKISQTTNEGTTYNVWDGWQLIEERGTGNGLLNTYVYGAGEIVERIKGSTARFYFQDGLGSTSEVSDAAGGLFESYKYGTFGQTSIYDHTGSLRKDGSGDDIRHLYTGQLWMPQTGLYDLRNRVFSPSLTRFLQPDPIGFEGDSSNLYRYCGNNPVNGRDPMGLVTPRKQRPAVPPLRPNHHFLPSWNSRWHPALRDINWRNTFGLISNLGASPTGGVSGPNNGPGSAGSGPEVAYYTTGTDVYWDNETLVVDGWTELVLGNPFPGGEIFFLPGANASLNSMSVKYALGWLQMRYPGWTVPFFHRGSSVLLAKLPAGTPSEYHRETGNIWVDPSQNPNMRQLVENVVHEFMHAGDGPFDQYWDQRNQDFGHITSNHWQIYGQATAVGGMYFREAGE